MNHLFIDHNLSDHHSFVDVKRDPIREEVGRCFMNPDPVVQESAAYHLFALPSNNSNNWNGRDSFRISKYVTQTGFRKSDGTMTYSNTRM